MIRVHTSNDLGELVVALAEALPRPGSGAGLDALFDSPWLVVPSRALETFVDLALARRRNISGGITTLTLRGAVARLCAAVAPDIVLVEREHILGELLAILEREDLQEGARTLALEPFHRYVRAAGDGVSARERRRLQLAGALAELFDDWSRSRPELLAAWRDGKLVTEDGESALLEAAERALWMGLFAADGRFARRGAAAGCRFVTIDRVLGVLNGPNAGGMERGAHERSADAARLPAQVHLFGMAEIPRAYFPLLEWLAARADVHIYAPNPCREFWEDLDTAKAARWRATHPTLAQPESNTPTALAARRRGGRRASDTRQLELGGLVPPAAESTRVAEPTSANDSPLLTLWGRAARDRLRLLGQLTDGDFESRFAERVTRGLELGSGRSSLLARLQQDVLDGKVTPAASISEAPDASIRILGAPDRRREWESIAAEIWALMRADATLGFSDIAVRIAGPKGARESAFPLASAVFQEAGALPFTWVDAALASTSHLGEALLQLMELFDGPFTRREVLDVITHPNIQGRFAGASSDAASSDDGPDSSIDASETWVELCEALGVAQGIDRTAFAGTYVSTDVFNWDQGIRRLALGMFAAGPRGGFETPLTGLAPPAPAASPHTEAEPASSYVPAEVPGTARAAADNLGMLVRSLIGDADFARQAKMTASEWVEFARAVLDSYTCGLGPADEEARGRILAALDELAGRVGSALRLPLPIAVTLMRDALASLRASAGQFLGAGVVVGTLQALRALPFRVVIVTGLDGNDFPATEPRSVFDPLAGPPRPAFPVGPSARERDQDLFLDAVLAARETLVLTCVDRDPFTAEPRVPSSVVVQLTDVLRQHYAVSDATEQSSARPSVRRLPLHRDEDPAIATAFPAAKAEALASDIGAAIRSHVPEAARLSGDALTRALSPEARVTLATVLASLETFGATGAAPGAAPSRAPPVVRLSELVRFLQCPLQGSARFMLRLRDVEDDADARDLENEPLEGARGLEMPLCTEAFLSTLANIGTFANIESGASATPPVSFAAAYDELAARQRFSARAPTGRFREHARTRALEQMNRWWEQLCVAAIGIVGPPKRICFGRPELLKPAAELRSPIRLTLPPRSGPADAGFTETVVELHGTTSPLVQRASGELGWLLPNRGKSSDFPLFRQRVTGFVDTLAYIASGGATPDIPAPMIHTLHLWGGGKSTKGGKGGKVEPALAVPLDRTAALAYLTMLTGELMAGVSPILFPCEAVFSAEKSGLEIPEQIAFMRGDVFYRPRLSTAWGPVPEPFEYPIPDAATALDLRRRRFAWLLGPEGKGASSAEQDSGEIAQEGA